MDTIKPLSVNELRWTCPDDVMQKALSVEETDHEVEGQALSRQALAFGLEIEGPGQNIFVRGRARTGRLRLVKKMLDGRRRQHDQRWDHCYVHNFVQADRPMHIRLEPGQGKAFRKSMNELCHFIGHELVDALKDDDLQTHFQKMQDGLANSVEQMLAPFQAKILPANWSVVTIQMGGRLQPALFPLLNGKPVPPEEFDHLVARGQINPNLAAQIRESRTMIESEFEELKGKVQELNLQQQETLRAMVHGEVRRMLDSSIADIRQKFKSPRIKVFLDHLVEDVVESLPEAVAEGDVQDCLHRYKVNFLNATEGEPDPVVLEGLPTVRNLIGSIEPKIRADGFSMPDHLAIHAGSMLAADGGFLVISAEDILNEPGAWRTLVRTLRMGKLDLSHQDMLLPNMPQVLKPEAIEIDAKVILIGDGMSFALLRENDKDFESLFKVLVDVEDRVPNDASSLGHYAHVISGVVDRYELGNFKPSAYAALAEYGARLASESGKLSAQFGRLADLTRESAHLARKSGRSSVGREEVASAVEASRQRSSSSSRRYRELLSKGVIRLETKGSVVGQINGVAVMSDGHVSHGFPARITASVGVGTGRLISIETEAAMSGNIHNKGFLILEGLLRHLLGSDCPLDFRASLAFEQSYGGIDGDSASAAEITCLISALSEVPVRQNLAMTGAIDQKGNILSVGGVNEKVEGFYDCCACRGLTGHEAILLPASNAPDLMLRPDVVKSCKEGKFSVYAIDRIEDALDLMLEPLEALDQDLRSVEAILETCRRRARMFHAQLRPVVSGQ